MARLFVFVVLAGALAAQTAAPVGATNSHSVLLASIEQASYTSVAHLQSLRIDKWKTESEQKQLAMQNVDSVLRNLSAALPTLVEGARSAPQGFGANFKLYRNLGALYDVMMQLTESAGAFGPKGEYQALAEVMQRWDEIRRGYGDYLEQLAATKDAAALPAATGPKATKGSRPRRIIVDDAEPTPKRKKK